MCWVDDRSNKHLIGILLLKFRKVTSLPKKQPPESFVKISQVLANPHCRKWTIPKSSDLKSNFPFLQKMTKNVSHHKLFLTDSCFIFMTILVFDFPFQRKIHTCHYHKLILHCIFFPKVFSCSFLDIGI